MVHKMIENNKKGLIMVANDKSQLVESMNSNSSKTCDDITLFKYGLYVIQRNLVILNEVNIDGNVYAIDNVIITTQLFVTCGVTIDQKLKQYIVLIQWNTKIHHDISVQLQCIDQSSHNTLLGVENFGTNHHYVANSYNNLGIVYKRKEIHNKAIECYEKALKINLEFLKDNQYDISELYNNLGFTHYIKMNEYDKSIEYFELSLTIKQCIFDKARRSIGDANWKLGIVYEEKGNM
ncbi:hypothetical protein RFI_06389 [Reticulomyxa filosa]|uniref:Uncharacterized protein n=1 Tax=Reticulomyxa filosa TaxID=46433 RepID=X6NZK1_RETFI|nr:hypothetical protein RFI_06389 [Reticulomyxa filosa]|eukprot:ETO30727.1 hypothetical protein RFI_06389 [Reticulomyxa filosa]